jgi:hypothetical protein
MGLSAVVFKNIRELENEFGHGLFEVDRSTGEAILDIEKGRKIPRPAFFAMKKRLGNVSEVEQLRIVVEAIVPHRNSIIQDRVLYSGSHSVDLIEVDQLSRLREEIDLLKSQQVVELTTFIQNLECLLAAAEKEGNPIVFV